LEALAVFGDDPLGKVVLTEAIGAESIADCLAWVIDPGSHDDDGRGGLPAGKLVISF
jgi:hypothetical protein